MNGLVMLMAYLLVICWVILMVKLLEIQMAVLLVIDSVLLLLL